MPHTALGATGFSASGADKQQARNQAGFIGVAFRFVTLKACSQAIGV